MSLHTRVTTVYTFKNGPFFGPPCVLCGPYHKHRIICISLRPSFHYPSTSSLTLKREIMVSLKWQKIHMYRLTDLRILNLSFVLSCFVRQIMFGRPIGLNAVRLGTTVDLSFKTSASGIDGVHLRMA